MNDSEVAGYRDKDLVQPGGVGGVNWRDGLKTIAGWSDFYGLLKYVALVVRFHPQTMGDSLKPDAKADASKAGDTVSYDDIEPWTRVSPHDFDRNIREMVTLGRSRGARVVLLDNELWPESPYRPVLAAIARDQRVPLVDSLRIIADERIRIERGMEARFHLAPAVGPTPRGARGTPTTVVFRV